MRTFRISCMGDGPSLKPYCEGLTSSAHSAAMARGLRARVDLLVGDQAGPKHGMEQREVRRALERSMLRSTSGEPEGGKNDQQAEGIRRTAKVVMHHKTMKMMGRSQHRHRPAILQPPRIVP